MSARREGRGTIVLRDTFPPGLAAGGPQPRTLGTGLFRAPEGGVCPNLCVCVLLECDCVHRGARVSDTVTECAHACLARWGAVSEQACGSLHLLRPSVPSWVCLQQGEYLPPDVSLASCVCCMFRGVERDCPPLSVSPSPLGVSGIPTPRGQQSSGFQVRAESRLLPICAERGSRQRGCRRRAGGRPAPGDGWKQLAARATQQGERAESSPAGRVLWSHQGVRAGE